jgi:hypothetical protein
MHGGRQIGELDRPLQNLSNKPNLEEGRAAVHEAEGND